MRPFAIRDLFWLAVLSAVATGWWFDHRSSEQSDELLQLNAERSALRERLDVVETHAKLVSDRNQALVSRLTFFESRDSPLKSWMREEDR